MTVDTTTGVPAGVGLVGVVHTHRHHIIALFHKWRDVVLKTRIAIRPMPHFAPINIDSGVHIDTIELNIEFRIKSEE